MLDFLPVDRCVIITYQSYHGGVICESDFGIWSMYRNEVMGERGVGERAEHTVLRDASAQGQRRRGEAV